MLSKQSVSRFFGTLRDDRDARISRSLAAARSREFAREHDRIAMRAADVHPAVIHAADVCDRIILESDRATLDVEVLIDWMDAILEHCRSHGTPMPDNCYLTEAQYARFINIR